MNVYDFDGTILYGDTENYFRAYVLKHFKIKLRHRIQLKIYDFLWKHRLIEWTVFHNHVYPYIMYIPNIEQAVKDLWNEHEKDIYPYYRQTHQDDDVVVSNTPSFLLEEIMRRLNIKTLISTKLDLKTGKIIGVPCRGEQKVVKYDEVFHQKPFDNYYFDRDCDMPLMKYAKNAYRVCNGELKKVK